jgi:hypothetical protein
LCNTVENAFGSDICAAGDALIRGDPGGTGMAFRQFPVPGIYNFHSTRTGATGRIVVTNELPADAAVVP